MPRTPLQLLGLNSGINPDVETLVLSALGIIVLTMINSLCDSLAEIYLAQGGRGVGYNMRVFLYGHLQKLSLTFHNQSRTGDILTRVTSDVAAVEDFIISNLSDFLGSALYPHFCFGCDVLEAPGISGSPGRVSQGDAAVFLIPLMAVFILPLMTLISNYYTGRIKAASKRLRSTEGELASAAQEMLTSIRVVQVYGQGSYEQSLFSAQSRKAMNAALDAAGYQARFSWVVSVLGAVATAAVICVGAWIIFRNPLVMGVGTAIHVHQMDRRHVQTYEEADLPSGTHLVSCMPVLERIGDLMDMKPEVRR